MSDNTQIAEVLRHLETGKTLTKSQAKEKPFSTNNLNSIIGVLRNKGYNIPNAELRLNLNTNRWYGEYYLILARINGEGEG